MTPLTSSTCRCTSLTFEEELAICACGSSAVAARAAAKTMNGARTCEIGYPVPRQVLL